MRTLTAILALSLLSIAQGVGGNGGMGGKGGFGGGPSAGSGGVSSNCGYSPATPASVDSNLKSPQATPCTTGANAAGYTVSSVSWYANGSGAETVDFGVYTDSSSSPSTLVCHTGTTGITAVVGYNTLSITGCGTLTASTNYWVASINTSLNYGYDAGNCPGFAVPMKGGTAQGTALLPTPFPSPAAFGECQAQYMTVVTN